MYTTFAWIASLRCLLYGCTRWRHTEETKIATSFSEQAKRVRIQPRAASRDVTSGEQLGRCAIESRVTKCSAP